MKYTYLVYPKNPNLYHSPVTFAEALALKFDRETMQVDKLSKINFSTSLELLTKITTANNDDQISVFFFSTQPEYIVLIFVLRCVSYILQKDLKIYHQMHEPTYEKGRSNLKTTLLVYWSNFILSRLADRIILSSQQAVSKGEKFIERSKIVQINLVFSSQNIPELTTSLATLAQSWEKLTTVSLIGIAAKDKNPAGFLALANIANRTYPDRMKFIRAGWDKDVKLDYSYEKIVHFPGYISNSAKKFLLSLTHVIVIPYNFSTQSGVISEALSYGKIVILNDIPAFDHFRGLKSVFTINFNDHEQIADCLRQISCMSVAEYESCYWASVNYFDQHNSVAYLKERLGDLAL
jgi:glycosyltransferase involved in cell wall biosynthesis